MGNPHGDESTDDKRPNSNVLKGYWNDRQRMLQATSFPPEAKLNQRIPTNCTSDPVGFHMPVMSPGACGISISTPFIVSAFKITC